MGVECELTLEYPSKREAEIILRAIEEDNEDFAAARVEGNRVIIRAATHSEDSMLHTLEDLLSCVSVAEEIIRNTGS